MNEQKGGNATSRVTPPLKWHSCGGKHYLASRIVSLMPKHTHFVEPFAGGLSVLLTKNPEGVSEVVNDIDSGLTNFWRVLQSPVSFLEFQRRCEATPFSEVEWRSASEPSAHDCVEPCVECAHRFFVLCRQSLAGRMSSFAPLSKRRTRRGMNEQASAWLSAVEGLPEVHRRLIRVAIRNEDALRVIQQEDSEQTLYYLDAPYVHSTRVSINTYTHEMTDDQHKELIDVILSCNGKFLVSMYHHPIYDVLSERHGWHLIELNSPNNAAGGSEKRRMIECLWMNYHA